MTWGTIFVRKAELAPLIYVYARMCNIKRIDKCNYLAFGGGFVQKWSFDPRDQYFEGWGYYDPRACQR
jgi:hypothetical protein